MSLVLKQETASSFPNPDLGKNAIFVDTGGSPHVITYSGQLILISPSAISPDILISSG